MHARNEEFLHASRVTRPRIWTGLLLNESYKVGSLVEQGAATEIYDGTEVSTGEAVALKILLPQLAEDARTRALFLDEARALRRLSQPGLLRYRACARDTESDLTYIVTDVVGMRLSSRLTNRNLSEDDVVNLTRRLALALSAAHGAGMVHRGLRPHAIALPQGKLSEATITDFNLIKSAHSGLNGAFDDAMVDHDFCAPEQLSTSGESAVVGPWTDVYSLALVILSALGGKQSDAERKANPDLAILPKKLRPVFEKMLEPKPARRLQSMDEVVKQIDVGPPTRSLLDRAQSVSFPRFGRVAPRETQPSARPVFTPPPRQAPPTPAVATPPVRQAQPASPPVAKAPPPALPAPPPKPTVAEPERPPIPPLPDSLRSATPPVRQAQPIPTPAAKAPPPVAPAPPPKLTVAEPERPPIPPLPTSLRPATPPVPQAQPASPPVAKAPPPAPPAPPPKAVVAAPERPARPPMPDSRRPITPAVSMGKFHERRASIGLGGYARRGAVALSALLLAASPWIIQTSLPPTPADASTTPPAKVQALSKGELAERAAAALPKGRVYGADNTSSRITLRFHRPTRVAVHSRQRLLFSRAVQPGDTYRVPSLTELAVTAEDAGAVEVLFNGSSAGFVGGNGAAVDKESLTRFASLAAPTRPNVAQAPTKAAEPGLSAEQEDALSKSIAAIDEAATPAEPEQALDQTGAPVVEAEAAPVAEQVIASAQPPIPPSLPLPAPPPAATEEVLPPPPAFVQVTPSRLGAVAVYVPPPQPLMTTPPPAQPEERRGLIGRLLGGSDTPEPLGQANAKAVILAPAISKEAADRAKAASDMAKAARDAAQQKARSQTKRREDAFFNTNMGVNSPY